jgi:hypothetical protein
MNKNPNLEGVIMFQMTIQAINVPDEAKLLTSLMKVPPWKCTMENQ